MSNAHLFTPDFKPTPYWWDKTPLAAASPRTEPPSDADVLVIGAGYTGLHAAIQTARRGLRTVIVDAEAAGHGCSTRNGGQISTSIKPTYAALTKAYGAGHARRIIEEGVASLKFTGEFIKTENIACDYKVVGRFHGAHSSRAFDKLAHEAATKHPVFDNGAYIVPRAEQHSELGTDAYHGGIVYPQHASLDPGLYHQGLLTTATSAGATIVPHCPATSIERTKTVFSVTTPNGVIRARKVVVATNGYTGPLTPWHRQRVIPIGSYVIATEELDADLMNRLMPKSRIQSDTRKLVFYYRPSPDRKRILFGGRVSLTETDPRVSGPKLHAEMMRLFPELAGARISHSWVGTVAYTFDTLMHTGEDNGLFYAMGYCGSGVGMASYLGMRIGQQAAGDPAGATAFDTIPFPTRPLYSGNPWFLAPSIYLYRVRDRYLS